MPLRPAAISIIQRLTPLALATAMVSCTLPTATRQSLADIGGREKILFAHAAYYGEVLGRSGILSWNGRSGPEPGKLVLTPTTLYFVYDAGDLYGSRSIAIAYSAIASAQLGTAKGPRLTQFGPWPSDNPLPDMLLVQTVAGGAGATYAGTSAPTRFAFHMLGTAGRQHSDAAAARRAMDVINSQRHHAAKRPEIARGRTAAAPFCGISVVNWQLQDALVKCGVAEAGIMAGSRLRKHFLPPAADWSQVFEQEFNAALRHHPAGRAIQLLPPVPPSTPFTEHAEKLSRQSTQLDRLMVISLSNTSFVPDSTHSRVTATYTIQIHHLTLHPATPGRCDTIRHVATRGARAWVDGGQALIHTDLKQAIQKALDLI